MKLIEIYKSHFTQCNFTFMKKYLLLFTALLLLTACEDSVNGNSADPRMQFVGTYTLSYTRETTATVTIGNSRSTKTTKSSGKFQTMQVRLDETNSNNLIIESKEYGKTTAHVTGTNTIHIDSHQAFMTDDGTYLKEGLSIQLYRKYSDDVVLKDNELEFTVIDNGSASYADYQNMIVYSLDLSVWSKNTAKKED